MVKEKVKMILFIISKSSFSSLSLGVFLFLFPSYFSIFCHPHTIFVSFSRLYRLPVLVPIAVPPLSQSFSTFLPPALLSFAHSRYPRPIFLSCSWVQVLWASSARDRKVGDVDQMLFSFGPAASTLQVPYAKVLRFALAK